ncbi:hypothetical protein BC829DRAFT_428903 [Chytridium lagenaria]|nr:hypothetical protein BC829DRAFT_428903 [Chytridium lagenaria]
MASPLSSHRSPSMAGASPLTSQASTSNHASPSTLPPASPSSSSRSPAKSIGDDQPTSPPRPRRAARNLLKNYYGITDAPSGAGSQDMENAPYIKPWGADPMDMDNEAFISETYIKNCLYEKNLSDLIRTDTELIAEIKDIDGQMKTLVYQNYHKFISATDTIKQMRTKVDDLQEEMDELERKINTVLDVNKGVNQKLDPNRSKLQKLHGVHGLLRKLNFVFELPSKLEAAFTSGHFKQAVKYHMATSALLEHYYHIPVFRKIDEECKEITIKVGIKVREKMKSPSSSISEIRESVGLLLGLNMQFPTELARDYLRTVKEKMSFIVKEASKEIDKASEGELPTDEAIPSFISKIRTWMEAILYPFSELVEAFDEYFLSEAKTTLSTTALPRAFAQMSSENPLNPRLQIRARFNPEQKAEAKQELFSLADELLAQLFTRLNRFIQLPSDVWSLNDALSVQILDCLSDEASKFQSLNHVVDMNARVRSVILGFFNNMIEQVYSRIRGDFFDEMKATSESSIVERKSLSPRIIATFVGNLNQKAFLMFDVFVKPELHYFSRTCISRDELLDLITTGLEDLWSTLKDNITNYYEVKHEENYTPPPSHVILFMAKCADELTATQIEQVGKSEQVKPVQDMRKNLYIVTASGGTVPSTASSGQSNVRRDHGEMKQGVELHAKHRDIVAQWREFSKVICEAYCFQISLPLTKEVELYIRTSNWFAESTPKRPAIAIENLVELFENVESEISTILVDEAIDSRERERSSNDFKRRLSVLPSRSNSAYNSSTSTPPLANPNPGLQRASSAVPAVLPRSSSFRSTIQIGAGSGLLSSNMFNMKRGVSMLSEKNSSSAQSLMGSSVGQHSRANSVAASGLLGSAPTKKFDAMLDNIGRLFSDRIDYYGPVAVTRCAALNAVARIIMKTYCETIKKLTMSRYSFNQVQIDAEYLRINLVKPAFCNPEDESIFAALAEDIVSSAFKRCVEPVPLDDTDVLRAANWKNMDYVERRPVTTPPTSGGSLRGAQGFRLMRRRIVRVREGRRHL